MRLIIILLLLSRYCFTAIPFEDAEAEMKFRAYQRRLDDRFRFDQHAEASDSELNFDTVSPSRRC